MTTASNLGIDWRIVRFRLDDRFVGLSPAELLAALGLSAGEDAEASLQRIIERVAAQLTLPDVCPVADWTRAIPPRDEFVEPLSAIAVMAKSSPHVWVRSKLPLVHAANERHSVSLFLTPAQRQRFRRRVPRVTA